MKTREQWQLHGNAPEIYERYLVPAVFAPWVPQLTAMAALRPGDHVLDVACGTGIVARGAARIVGTQGRVGGVDLNRGMLDVARSIPPEPGATEVEWHESSVEDMPFEDAAFDAAFCQQGLQYFLDPREALREIRRVLALDGRLVLSVWPSLNYTPGYAALAEALEKYIGPQTRNTMTAPFSLNDPAALRAMLVEAEFREVSINPKAGMVRFSSPEEFVIRRLSGSPLADAVRAVDDDVRLDIVKHVASRLRAYTTNDGLAFPIETNIAVAVV